MGSLIYQWFFKNDRKKLLHKTSSKISIQQLFYLLLLP